MCVFGPTCVKVCVEVRGQFGVVSLLPPNEFWQLNSDSQAWWQVSTKPSHQVHYFFQCTSLYVFMWLYL